MQMMAAGDVDEAPVISISNDEDEAPIVSGYETANNAHDVDKGPISTGNEDGYAIAHDEDVFPINEDAEVYEAANDDTVSG
jgi:hypothetical protein